jgi:hypothetical protein
MIAVIPSIEMSNNRHPNNRQTNINHHQPNIVITNNNRKKCCHLQCKLQRNSNSCMSWLCQFRRLGLIFAIFLIFLLIFQDIYTLIYFPIIVFLLTFILFWNFPEVLLFLHSKPVYIDDLFIDPSSMQEGHTINPRMIEKFRNAFIWSHNIVGSLFAAGLADFFLYRIQNRLSIYEALGVLGGILNIYNILIIYFGKFLLYILIQRKMDIIRNTPISPRNIRSGVALNELV